MKKQLLIHPSSTFDITQQTALFLWPFLTEQVALDDIIPHVEAPSLSHTDQKKIHDALLPLTEHLVLPHLQKELNQRHNVDYNSEYWAILLDPWLSYVVNTTYYYYISLDTLLKKNPNTSFWVNILETPIKWESKDTFDFVYRSYQDPDLHWMLLSILIKNCFSKRIEIQKHIPLDKKTVCYHDGIESIKDHRSRRFLMVKGVSTVQELGLSLFLQLLPPKKNPKKSFHTTLSTSIQEWPTLFLKTVLELSLKTLPESFDRNFSRLDNRAKKQSYKKGKIRVIGPVTVLYEQIKFYIAHAHTNQEIIISTQHGGNYGWHLIHREPMLIDYKFDHFLSWGWALANNTYDRVKALPSPYMSRFKNRACTSTSNLILVGTDINPYSICFLPNPFAGKALYHYRQNKVLFLNQLHTDIGQHVLYRGYPLSEGRFPDDTYIRTHIPNIQTLSGNLHPHLFAAKLVCMDHLGTTLSICLAANIPFICFWDPSYCDLNPTALEWTKLLREEGLYFDSPIEAAKQINSIWNTISEWWETKKNVVSKLRQLHANTDPWVLEWMRFLKNL